MTSQLLRMAPPPSIREPDRARCAVPFRRTAILRENAWGPSVRCLLRLMHLVIVRLLRAAAQRRELAQLSGRQLRDAGIDPALAGRGKAIAVDRSTLLRLLTLSQG
jgi:uncharacterized protein YjiS (DUF1127 family)